MGLTISLVQKLWTAFSYQHSIARKSVSQLESNPSDIDEEKKLKPDPYDARPRNDYLSKDDYFMAVAYLSAQRSKDPNKQVGCCIVDHRDVILGIGYNGFPRGCPDTSLPWSKCSLDKDPLQTKYPYVVHAEANAILNKNHADLTNSRMYVTLFPCNECAKLLIQAGIKEIIYSEEKKGLEKRMYEASRIMFRMAGIKTRQLQSDKTIRLRI